MSELTIGSALLKDMLLTGAALLEKNRAAVDALNVFPVPDGDTGTNMFMTMQSASKEIKNCSCETISEVADAASLGALKGARGNSGVILSQLFRGFAKALKGAEELDAKLFSEALKAGADAAYKAVMKPKEGTILTVARMISEAVEKAQGEGANIYRLVDIVLESGEAALKITPDLLPVLKEAGVIDAGGKGLLLIYRGFKMAIDGEEIGDEPDDMPLLDSAIQTSGEEDNFSYEETENIKFGYCTEFFIINLSDSFSEYELDQFREKLDRIGDSAVVVHDGGLVKVHVHSNAPGKIIQLALRLGEVDKLKIDNMRQQNRDIIENLKRTEKEMGIVVVSAGSGLDTIFSDLGATGIISGGQTMNPSIETIQKAIRKVNARNVFVFPNNPNIILAAQQAAELSERNVILIPTKTILQGIAGVMAFNGDMTPKENEAKMTAAYKDVISGAVTYAVRDTSINGSHISQGDTIGLIENKIVTHGESVDGVTKALVHEMISQKSDDCIVTIFYGESMDEDNARQMTQELESEFPDAEFIIQQGGQPLYYYYISVE